MTQTDQQPTPSLWRTPGVLSGMVAMAMIGVAVMTPGFVPNRGLDQIGALKLLRTILKHQIGHVLMPLGVILLFRSWLVLRPARVGRVNHALILALWSFPVLLAPPLFSSDAFLYADQGWAMHKGLNPYEVGLAQSGGPFAANVHPVWRGTTAVYPPLALVMQHLVAWATGFKGLVSVIAMRLPALVGVAVIAWAVPRIARQLKADPQVASWFALLNPLMLIHFVGGMHNDIPMVAMVAVAVWLTLRFGVAGLVPAAILVGLGAAFKQPGIIAALAVGLIPIAPRLRDLALVRRIAIMAAYCAAAVLIAAGTFAVVSWLTGLGYGWTKATKIHEATWGMSPASMIEQFVGPVASQVLDKELQLLPLFTRVTTVLSAIVAAGLAWRYFFADRVLPAVVRRGGRTDITDARDWTDRPVRWLAWAFAAVGLGGAGFHGWYLIWGGLYVGVLRYSDRVLRALIGVMIMFIIVEGGLEYFGLRPIPGYLFGAAMGWLFYTNSSGTAFNPQPVEDDAVAGAAPR